jgi:hypothetical protein
MAGTDKVIKYLLPCDKAEDIGRLSGDRNVQVCLCQCASKMLNTF